MEFTIYRDLASIAFVRCVSPIPGTRIHAEGTGFSVATAIAKCRSERIEAGFQLAHTNGSRMLGIAAHPNPAASAENAWNETLETLLLQRLSIVPVFYGVSFAVGEVRLCLGRIEDRFIAVALFFHRGEPTATQAVSRNPLRALLKAWSELRNLRLYNPTDLSRYTKANQLMTAGQLANLSVRPSWKKNIVAVSGLKQFQQERKNHTITYYLKEHP